MRPRDPRFHGGSIKGGGKRRVIAQLLLLVILALAPALDHTWDGGTAGLPSAPIHALDLCTVPGLTPPPPFLAPVMAMARVTETEPTSLVSLPTRPVDHPPRLA